MKSELCGRWPTLVLAMSVIIAFTDGARGYDQYSQAKDATNCRACHGDFRALPYTELAPDGDTWPAGLMDTHVDFIVSGECNFCHSVGPRFPVFTSSSAGTTGFDPIGCTGCHGRLADASSGTVGAGAGLRRHHIVTGASDCWEPCHNHADADPTGAPAPVGENVPPPHFRDPPDPDFPDIPSDPCNPRASFPENKAGNTRGLDNDGNGVYDGNDAVCVVGIPTPGEASEPSVPANQLVVTAHDPATRLLSIQYATACSATDNAIEFGDLADVGLYLYSGQRCGIGNAGSYGWTYPPSPDSFFFVVVANDGTVEGSYGKDSSGVERPEDALNATCPNPQGLADRCD